MINLQKYVLLLITTVLVFGSCKNEFLDAKPNSSIVNPTTLAECQSLLDHTDVLNKTGALPQIASDEYEVVTQQNFDALATQTEKNAYLRLPYIYEDEVDISDWSDLYQSVFYSNSVLEVLTSIPVNSTNSVEHNHIKGQALFLRAYAFYDLAKNFCPVYNEITADQDLGIPLRLTAGINETLKRATLKETYVKIIEDLNLAKSLLKEDFSALHRNRASKAAVSALLARMYLAMGKYDLAYIAANECLNLHNKVIDYNTISLTSNTPFSVNADETIFYSSQVYSYANLTGYNSRPSIAISDDLIKLYDKNDLRLSIFFLKNPIGNYNVKRSYSQITYHFSGLATDEIILIKSECLVRKGDRASALALINSFLLKRYSNKAVYVPLTAATDREALDKVLLERRKELMWRGMRWSDLKRLNRDGANIVLKRRMNNKDYELLPNSNAYVFPIPNDEIMLSGIQQNKR